MHHAAPRLKKFTPLVLSLLGGGIAVFLLSFWFNLAAQNFFVGDLCEMTGTAGLVFGAYAFVRRLRIKPYVEWIFLAGCVFLVLARAVDFTEELEWLRGAPLIGNGGLGQDWMERGSESFGYICILLTLLALMYEQSRLINRAEAESSRYKELFEASQYLARVADLSADAVFAVDQNGVVQVWNMGAERLFGYPRQQAVGMRVCDLIVSGLEPLISDPEGWLAKGAISDIETIAQRSDGSRFAAGASVSAIRRDDGTRLGASIIVRDIEARKRAERELVESRNLLSGALQAADVGLFIIDRRGELIEFNPRMEELTGLSLSSIARQTAAVALPPLFDDPAFVRRVFSQVIGRGEHAEFRNLRVHRPDGSTRVCNGALAPVFDADGQVVGAAGVAVDVTEREALQNRLLESQKMDSIGRLAGGIAHDFNNLLAGILGYASLAREDLEPDSPLYRYLEGIEASAARAAELTHQLLTFSKGGKRNEEALNLNELIAETLKLTARTLGPNVNVRTTLAADLDTVRADRSQMSQVLMNLLLNARDAVSGNGEIWVSTANVTIDAAMRVRLQLDTVGRCVRITVEDNGCGIAPEVAQRIFEPFFSTKKHGQAYGLGLSVVYGIVRSHSGGIHVESEVGKGTRIHVYLPSAAIGAPSETPLRARADRSGKSETILVVDDEKLLRAMLQDILETSGYRVLEAATGEEALEIYNDHKDEIGVIILDIIMPGMGGARALERLKQINPDLRCIVSSGYGVETLDDGLLNGKHIRFVGKPYKSSSVVSTVREMLEN